MLETKAKSSSEFTLPGAEDRVAVIGATGTGKTVFAAWILSRQRFDKRPWVAVDFKDEILWDQVGSPPMRELKLNSLPGKRGFYRLRVNPGQEEQFETWLWKVWKKENIGLFVDEVSLVPQRDAFKAVLRQGRSKRIPVIACTQRPVDCDREVFSEAQYISVFRLDDIRDYKIIKGFTREAPIEKPLPEHWSHWYDKKKFSCMTLQPCPAPDKIASNLRDVAPRQWYF